MVAGFISGGFDNQIFCDAVDPEKSSGDQDEQAEAKKEAAFSLEVGFPENAFDRSIAHCVLPRLAMPN